MKTKYSLTIFCWLFFSFFLFGQKRAHSSYYRFSDYQKGNYGFVDKSGKMVIPPKYTFAKDFSEGLALVGAYANRHFINQEGESVLSGDYEILDSFSENLAPVELLDERLGYIDKSGKLALGPFGYSEIWAFSGGMACIRLGGSSQFEYIDREGKRVTSSYFNSNVPFTNGYAPVYVSSKLIKKKKNGLIMYLHPQWGLIDKSGKMVIKPKYSHVGSFHEGLIAVDTKRFYIYDMMTGRRTYQDKRCMGFVDISGKIIIKPKYYLVGAFSEGVCLVKKKKNGKWGYIDKRGKMVSKPKFQQGDTFIAGLAAVKINGKWGYINKSGTFVIAPRFDEALPFCEGFAAICVDKKWGYIDKNGNYLIKPTFLAAYYFSDGLARVKVGN